MLNKSQVIKDAQKFVAKGQLDKAIAEYNKLLKESPTDANTHNTVGDLYLKKNSKEEAIESYKKAAEILNKNGFTLKAIALYKKVLNINPDQVDVFLTLGKLNAERGMLGNANESYLAAANYFAKQGKKDRALDVYKTLCGLNPDNHGLVSKLADLYMNEGLYAEGVSKYIELAEKKVADGSYHEARDFLDKATVKGSERFDFKRVMAMLDMKEGRLAEALRELEEARILDPNDDRITALLAECYMRSGRYEEAEALYRILSDKDPKNEEYSRQLVDLGIKIGSPAMAWDECRALAEKHIGRNERDEAERLLKEYIARAKDSIPARQALIGIYSDSAREMDLASLHKEMADIYAQSGEADKAANIYRKLLEKDPDDITLKSALEALGLAEAPPEAPADAFHAPPTEEFQAPSLEGPQESPEEALGIPPREGGTDYAVGVDAFQAEETPQAGGAYELPESLAEELPPLDLGADEDLGVPGPPEAAGKVFELPEAGADELDGLDIFETGAPPEETAEVHGPGESQTGMTAFPSHSMPGEEAGEPAAAEEPVSFEESLTEVDVYIKYGLTIKAIESLDNLEETYPDNPELIKRRMEICKVDGNVEGFVEHSLKLAEVFGAQGLNAEAEDTLRMAFKLDPDNEELKARFETISPVTEPVPEESAEEEAPQGGPAAPEEVQLEEAEAPFGFGESMLASDIAHPSVQYTEEMAEADFYAQQGLVEEARNIYRRILAANPENEEVRAKYEGLKEVEERLEVPELILPPAVEEKAAPQRPAPPTPVHEEVAARPRAASFDDELDAAFREMDMTEEAPVTEAPVEVLEAEPAQPEPVEAEAAPAQPAQEDEFFDLAAELKDELEAEVVEPVKTSDVFVDQHLEDMFKEFKKGVDEQLDKEDYETHYNLGIAYKEMGMLREAISEFVLAARDPLRTLDCASMLGLCYIEDGDYAKSVDYFKQGLAVKGRDKEEYLGLKYDMATAYELAGDLANAQAVVSEIAAADVEFRDIKKRLQRLNKSITEAGGKPAPAPPAPHAPPAPPEPVEKKEKTPTPGKKSKVSYI